MAGRAEEHAWRVLIDSSGYQPPLTSMPQLSSKFPIQIVDIEQFSTTMPNGLKYFISDKPVSILLHEW